MKVDPDQLYLVTGKAVRLMMAVKSELNDPRRPLDADRHRDMANALSLALFEVTNEAGNHPDTSEHIPLS